MSDLQAVKAFYEAVSPACQAFYKTAPLNEFWGGLNEKVMKKIIIDAKSLTDLVHGAQKTFMFSVNVTEPVKERAVKWLLAERAHRMWEEARVPHQLPGMDESPFSFEGNNVIIEEKGRFVPERSEQETVRRVFTPDFIRCTNIAARIAMETDLTGARVVELGGGLGHLARVVRLAGISKQHIIIDLPETLCFSFAFLRLNFPEADVQLLTSQAEAVRPGADFVFCPVAFADQTVGSLAPDLFLNTASMGEMRNETIRYWMKFIQKKLNPRFLFMLNRFLNTTGPGLAWRAEENECQQHYDRNWKLLNWEIEPSYIRCPYVDTLVSRYVEIIAERALVGEEAAKAKAAEHHAEVADEDWWRQRADRKSVV